MMPSPRVAVPRVSAGAQGELEHEACPTTGAGLRPELPATLGRPAARPRQAEPARALASGVGRPIERCEDLLDVLFGDARALVFDAQRHAISLNFEPSRDHAARWAVLDRVEQEGVDQPLERLLRPR